MLSRCCQKELQAFRNIPRNCSQSGGDFYTAPNNLRYWGPRCHESIDSTRELLDDIEEWLKFWCHVATELSGVLAVNLGYEHHDFVLVRLRRIRDLHLNKSLPFAIG